MEPEGIEPAAHRRPVARDRLWPHLVWEIVLAAGVVVAVFAVRHEDRQALSGAGLDNLLVLVAAGILLGSAFALSLRAAVPNLAVGAVAVVAGVLTALAAGRARLRAADAVLITLGGAVALGLVTALVVVGFRLPAWAVGLGAAFGLLAAAQSLSAGRTLTWTACRTCATGPGRWPSGRPRCPVLGGVLGLLPRARLTLGQYRPGGDAAAARGSRAGLTATAALVGSMLLAAGAGLILAMRVRTAVPDDGFALLGTAAAAAFLGGTSAYGRRGGVFGTALAAGFLQLAALWLGLVEAEPWTRPALLGGAIVLGLLVGRVVEAAGTVEPPPPDEADEDSGRRPSSGTRTGPGASPGPARIRTRPVGSRRPPPTGREPSRTGRVRRRRPSRSRPRPSRPVTSVPTGSRAATSVSSRSRAEAPSGDRPGRPDGRWSGAGATGCGGGRGSAGRPGPAHPVGRARSRPFGTPVALKLELLQHTGSFKARGMLNRLLAADLPAGSRVVAASGGNAGLAVAYAARELGLTAHIVVPVTAPPVKVARLRALGAAVVQEGAVYAEAFAVAEGYATRAGLPLVHAYDQPEVCAGNGTLGLELIEQVVAVDTVLVATGGGGLIAGVAAALVGRARVIAVEPERCPTLHKTPAAGTRWTWTSAASRPTRSAPAGSGRSAGRSPRRPG